MYEARIRIDLSKIAPDIAEELNEIRRLSDQMHNVSRKLYQKLGFDLMPDMDVIEEEKPE